MNVQAGAVAGRVVLRETDAWDLIGFDGSRGESVRVKGGRVLYEAVVFNDCTRGDRVRLDRLVVGRTAREGLRVVNRYVDADTRMEVVADG